MKPETHTTEDVQLLYYQEIHWREECARLSMIIGENVQNIHRLKKELGKIASLPHGMPRDDHGAGSYYQEKLSIAQGIAERALLGEL